MTIKEAQDKMNKAAINVVLSGRPVAYLPKALPGEKYVLVGLKEFEALCKAEKEFDAVDVKFSTVL